MPVTSTCNASWMRRLPTLTPEPTDAWRPPHHRQAGRLWQVPLFRVAVQPNELNGLRATSQIMVDKIMTVKRDKLGPGFGRIDQDLLIEVERSMALFLGIAK
jgi:hypothetical protein